MKTKNTYNWLVSILCVLFAFAILSCTNPFYIKASGLYEVSFSTNGGTKIEAIRTTCIKEMPISEKEDCTLEGWFTTASFSGIPVTFPFDIEEDTTLYAKWKQNIFTVSFETNCDTTLATYKTDAIKDAPIVTKADYVFVGWYTSSDFKGTPVAFPYTLTANTTLYAKWAQSVFTVSFETNCDSEIAPYRTDTIESSPDIAKNDYILAGWYTTPDFSGSPVSFPYTLTDDTILYAKWAQSIFTVSFVTNCDSEIASYKTDSIESIVAISKNDYVFVGWYTTADFKGTPITFPYTLSEDTTLYAKWAQTVFTVNFVTNCDIPLASYKTDSITSSPTIVRTGYELVGWYTSQSLSGTPMSFPYVLTKDVTLYAKWKQTSFLVEFETNCDVPLASYKTDSIESAPAIERTGYELIGWYTSQDFSGSAIQFPYTLTKNVTFYAKWKQTAFLVSFESNGGTAITAYTTSQIESTPATTRENYVFGGWYTTSDYSGNSVSFPYTLTEEVTLYAKWLAIYNVAFETNEGTAIDSYRTAQILTVPETTRDGYTFVGWYSDSELKKRVVFPLTLTENIILYARWGDESNTIIVNSENISDIDVSTFTHSFTVIYQGNLSIYKLKLLCEKLKNANQNFTLDISLATEITCLDYKQYTSSDGYESYAHI